MSAKISVVIPLYNKEREIERAIESVLRQTHQDFEVIVVDDCSSDGGADIVKNFRDPRVLFVEQGHRGVAFTRNHGAQLATADYIAFLDADDEWLPRHLEAINRLVDNWPAAGIYTTAYKIQERDGRIRWANYRCIPEAPWEGLIPDYFRSICFGDFPVHTSCAVIPKRIFAEMEGFAEGYWGEDADLFARIALKYPVAFSWEPGEIYHWDASNRACDNTFWSREIPFVDIARAALEKDEVPVALVESVKEYIAEIKFLVAVYNLHTGNQSAAKRLLNEAKTNWHWKKKVKWLILASIPQEIFRGTRNVKRQIDKALGRGPRVRIKEKEN